MKDKRFLYDSICRRRSVREYLDESLDNFLLNDIMKFAENVCWLDISQCRFVWLGKDDVTDKRAPHYLSVYGDGTQDSLINAGYALAQIDLYIQSLGLGGCFLGLARAPKTKEDPKNFCILYCFGKSEVPFRKSEDEFDRMPVEGISNKDNPIARACRLAPSSCNSQPWKLNFNRKGFSIHYDYNGKPLYKKMLEKRENKIDFGIVRYYADLARNILI